MKLNRAEIYCLCCAENALFTFEMGVRGFESIPHFGSDVGVTDVLSVDGELTPFVSCSCLK